MIDHIPRKNPGKDPVNEHSTKQYIKVRECRSKHKAGDPAGKRDEYGTGFIHPCTAFVEGESSHRLHKGDDTDKDSHLGRAQSNDLPAVGKEGTQYIYGEIPSDPQSPSVNGKVRQFLFFSVKDSICYFCFLLFCTFRFIDLFYIGMEKKTDNSNNDIDKNTENITIFPSGFRVEQTPYPGGGNRAGGKAQTPGKSVKGGTADQGGSSFLPLFQCRHDDLKRTIKKHRGKSCEKEPVILKFDIFHCKKSAKGDDGKSLSQKNKFYSILFILDESQRNGSNGIGYRPCGHGGGNCHGTFIGGGKSPCRDEKDESCNNVHQKRRDVKQNAKHDTLLKTKKPGNLKGSRRNFFINLCLIQCLTEIGDNIINMLDPDRKTDEIR